MIQFYRKFKYFHKSLTTLSICLPTMCAFFGTFAHSSIVSNLDIRGQYVPVIRSDYMLLSHYKGKLEVPFNLPIIRAAGREDRLYDPKTFDFWAKYTNQKFQLEWFPGDHFFGYNESRISLIQFILKNLETFRK